MIKFTDEKTVVGRISSVGSSRPYGTVWGELLFTGRRVSVSVRCGKRTTNRIMYIKDDSSLGRLDLSKQTLKAHLWEIRFHGEEIASNEGFIIVDGLELYMGNVHTIKIDKLFN
ncbi:MAG: hypothetical protein MJZ77_05545 [Bacteroidales bacterium]|nr:hypothetical protein [Bacteroidales bacterium]